MAALGQKDLGHLERNADAGQDNKASMSSPRAIKIKSKKTLSCDVQSTRWEFNTYKSGGGISLPSKQDVIEVNQACDIRYFEHLPTSNAYKRFQFKRETMQSG